MIYVLFFNDIFSIIETVVWLYLELKWMKGETYYIYIYMNRKAESKIHYFLLEYIDCAILHWIVMLMKMIEFNVFID